MVEPHCKICAEASRKRLEHDLALPITNLGLGSYMENLLDVDTISELISLTEEEIVTRLTPGSDDHQTIEWSVAKVVSALAGMGFALSKPINFITHEGPGYWD